MERDALLREYGQMRDIARDLGYQSFTELQETAFLNEDVYAFDKALFVIGQTSSGKTLIPMLMYYRSILEADRLQRERPRMIFAVPYRALAAQKTYEIARFFEKLQLTVAVSTAEFRENDDEIRRGAVDVAVVINEKVYKFATQNEEFLNCYDYLVLDEVGLIGDSERGMKLDFLISWIYARKIRYNKPRLILLGTPNYNWDAYCTEFQLTQIYANTRPIPLEECLIRYDKNNILEVTPRKQWLPKGFYVDKVWYEKTNQNHGPYGTACECLPAEGARCPLETPCRSDESLPCAVTGAPCTHHAEVMPKGLRKARDLALYRICLHHLLLGHQILIFINDREQARMLCRMLYLALKDVLPEGPELADYKAELFGTCNLDEEDLFGVMEDLDADPANRDIYYEAFRHGVGFHSAAVPNELRTFIERGLLEEGTMRIVCSTETLAFGVNSNVDAVIIADLRKPGNDSGRNIERITRRLSANEYKNYIGRAGRLSRNRRPEDACGYVYTMSRDSDLKDWTELQEEAKHPLAMHSLLFDSEDSFLTFFILNLFSEINYSVDDLMQNISRIPRPADYSLEALEADVQHALQYLKDQKLIRNPPIDAAQDTDNRRMFRLTGLGACLKGYVIGESDFIKLFGTMNKSIGSNLFAPIDVISILYACICTKHAERSLRKLNVNERFEFSDRMIYEQLCALLQDAVFDQPPWLRYFGEHLAAGDLSMPEKKRYRVLAALIAWMRGETTKKIYTAYGIHYALIAKVSEQLCYLLEIAESVMPYVLEQTWNKALERKEFRALLEQYSWEELRDQRLDEIRQMHTSLFFGLNGDTWHKFLSFLQNRGDEEAMALIETYGSTKLNPQTARKLKKLFDRYHFFRNEGDHAPEDPQAKAAWTDRRKQYITDIHQQGDLYISFFREAFGDRWDGDPE